MNSKVDGSGAPVGGASAEILRSRLIGWPSNWYQLFL